MTDGRIEEVEPDLLRVVAPNPSPFTAEGTNTWLVGDEEVCVIDPGPDDLRHLGAILEALGGRRLGAIVVTHAHLDHSGLAPVLASRTGAPVMAHGGAQAGWRPEAGRLRPGPGVDRRFKPDRRLRDGELLGPWGLAVLHTPGHMVNHVCLDDGRRLFTGDLAMGFATSVVSPPEGDMGDYMDSLGRLAALGPRVLLPGHGAPVPDGPERLRALLEHRRTREAEVMAALEQGPESAERIAGRLYTGLPPVLLRAARRTVLAHLIDLERRGLVAHQGEVGEAASFRRV